MKARVQVRGMAHVTGTICDWASVTISKEVIFSRIFLKNRIVRANIDRILTLFSASRRHGVGRTHTFRIRNGFALVALYRGGLVQH